MQFRLLGPVQAITGITPLSLGQPKQRVVLATLLLRRGHFVSRDELLQAVWGEQLPRSAVGSLHVYVHGLRRVLGAERIEARGEAYRIRLEPDELDLERFERLTATAKAELSSGAAKQAAELLEHALTLWRGPALADLGTEGLAEARGQLEEERLVAVELLAEAHLAAGAPEQALSRLATVIPAHLYRERLRELRILALYRAGRQQDALDAYQEARSTLVEELGIEPGPRLQELQAAVLRQAPELDRPALPPAPVEMPGATRTAPLPASPTRLIGRYRELEEIETLFAEHGARMVTLTGPGGTGKTRLALAVAESATGRLPADVAFVDLGGTTDPGLVLPLIAEALEVPVEHPLGQSLVHRLRSRRMLLVLDNLERLVACGPDLAELLAGCPGLLLLVTSRVPLRLRAEYEYSVGPLPLPPPGAGLKLASESEAVQLLAERARAVDRNLQLTEQSAPGFVRICRRLDGLPLALELAAGRLRGASVEDVAAGLEHALEIEGPVDLPARQQTLRATLDWSHQQLDSAAQQLLARLGAFQGGFDAEAVEAVCSPGTVPTLGALVEASLLRRTEAGFTMLETVREYAAERLAASGEERQLRARHARYFLETVEQARQALMAGDDQAAALHRMDAIHENVLEAFDWAARSGEVEMEVRLVLALRQFWLVRGRFAEGRAMFERAVSDTADAAPALHAQALLYGAAIVYRQADLVTARAWWEEALVLLQAEGDEMHAAHCAAELGSVAYSEGDLEQAADLYAQAAAGFIAAGERSRLAMVIGNQAQVAADQGNLAQAIQFGDEAVDIAREVGDSETVALNLHNAARLALAGGDADRARRLLAESLAGAVELGYLELLANCIQATGALTLTTGGEPEVAARLQAAARHALNEIGVVVQGLEAESFAQTERALTERLGSERLAEIAAAARDDQLDAITVQARALLEHDRVA